MMFDILITGGRVVDGSGNPWFHADVGITGDRLTAVGPLGHPDLPDRWSSVAEYLALFERRCALNIAYLIPNGNVRMEVMGLATRPATADELKQMGRLVRQGMEEGAVGLSSGL